MLAPAFEAALDRPTFQDFDLLSASRELWPSFAERLGGADIGLRRTGALWVDGVDEAGLVARDIGLRLDSFGAVSRMVSAAEVRELAPGIRPDVAGGLFTPED